MLDTYKYSDAQGNSIWGQITRFQAKIGTGVSGAPFGGDCCAYGSRVPLIWVRQSLNGTNHLQVAMAIGTQEGIHFTDNGNYVMDFIGDGTPSPGEWFTLTISQTPTSMVNYSSQLKFSQTGTSGRSLPIVLVP